MRRGFSSTIVRQAILIAGCCSAWGCSRRALHHAGTALLWISISIAASPRPRLSVGLCPPWWHLPAP